MTKYLPGERLRHLDTIAAAHGHLHVLQWLQENAEERPALASNHPSLIKMAV